MPRRRLLGVLAGGIGATLLAACDGGEDEGRSKVVRERAGTRSNRAGEDGRLHARPQQPTEEALPAGLHPLGLGDRRDGLLYVPDGYRPDRPAPLVLMLHGAGGVAQHGLDPFMGVADEAGLLLLAPDSRRQTWDVLVGGYGPDIDFIDRALAQTFSRFVVDPGHIAVEGFSDGASYALSVGITNGDLFTHVIAFSPGFAAPADQRGAPRLFISHGVEDNVLPIDRCSRRIVPRLRGAGYDLHYLEFDGGHWVPPEIVAEALVWFRDGN